MFQQGLKLIGEKPELLAAGLNNAGKFVPNVVVSGSGGLEGAAAIFGSLVSGDQATTSTK